MNTSTKQKLYQARSWIKYLIQHATGLYIYKRSELEIGACLKNDIIRFLGSGTSVVLDVGANVGQSATQYNYWFTTAKIYSFEPFKDTYHMLTRNTSRAHRIFPQNIALSDNDGVLRVAKSSVFADSTNSLRAAESISDDNAENIFCRRLDSWLFNERIQHVDFMKVDVEGYELEVIRGAEQSFREGKVDLALFEAGIGSSNSWNTLLHKIVDTMNAYHYELIGLYDTSLVQLKSKSHYTNALFASPILIDSLPPLKDDITHKGFPFKNR